MTGGLTIKRTEIGGDEIKDDFVVREDGYGCGRIHLGFVAGAEPKWLWYINPPVPISGANTTGTAETFQQASEQWKAAWALARPSLTDDDVRHWHELEDGVRARFGTTSTG